jgi:hypothetical protein
MTKTRRGALIVALGLALTGGIFGFAVPAQALSITGTYTNVELGSPGTQGAAGVTNTGFLQGLVQNSLSLGFPAAAPTADGATYLSNNFWSVTGTGVSADPVFGTRVDNPTGLNLNFPSNFYASSEDQTSQHNVSSFLAVHWTAAFSNPGNVTFHLQSDDHAFLFIDGQLVLDNGGIKGVGDAQSGDVIYSLAGNHTLDLFFADVFQVQSGIIFSCTGCEDPSSTVPEPATLVLFGSTLVGLGTVVRRRFKGAKQSA